VENVYRFARSLAICQLHLLRVSASLRETLAILVVGCSFLAGALAQAENWDRFRGPNGAGQSEAEGIPSQWTEADYLWKKSLPGVGHSSPVVWGDRVFVTSGDPTTGEQIVLAFDTKSGQQLWEKRFASHTYSMHSDNSYATSTPAADADQLYVLWLDGNRVTLAALTHDGGEVWRRQVGSLVEKHGFGTSPVVVGNTVCVANETDSADRCIVTGVDRTSGDIRWAVHRNPGKTAFATPCLLDSGGRKLLVMSSMGSGVTAYEPETGEIAWQVLEKDLPDRCVSSPIVAAGLVFVSCGSGNNGLHLIALRPGENGEPPVEAYRLKQGVPNIPTPVAAGDLLFVWHDRGTVTCLDAATGEPHWRKRVSGMFHSSPVRIGNRIFGLSKDGDVTVLAADKEYQLLARNSLGEPSQATPAVADGRIYYRTEASLICLGSGG
jgi:outer membrane protein assembly factor BamB